MEKRRLAACKRSAKLCDPLAKTLQIDLKLTVEPRSRGIPPGTAADPPKPPKGAKGDAYATAYSSFKRKSAKFSYDEAKYDGALRGQSTRRTFDSFSS